PKSCRRSTPWVTGARSTGSGSWWRAGGRPMWNCEIHTANQTPRRVKTVAVLIAMATTPASEDTSSPVEVPGDRPQSVPAGYDNATCGEQDRLACTNVMSAIVTFGVNTYPQRDEHDPETPALVACH